jgi:hypothetical protein
MWPSCRVRKRLVDSSQNSMRLVDVPISRETVGSHLTSIDMITLLCDVPTFPVSVTSNTTHSLL